MITLPLFDFQQNAVQKLLGLTESLTSKQKIIVKSPTGSGKTVILVEYIDEYLENRDKTAFIWLCPGKGALEEQSRKKMLKYAPDRRAQTLDDALSGGFVNKSTTFINWEKITKKGNTAIKDSEKQNLFDQIARAHRNGISFIIVVDEEHSNNTAKAQEIIDAFEASHIIRMSATTYKTADADFFEIDEDEVIASGLITRAIYINENINDDPDADEDFDILLHTADKKRKEIIAEYDKLGKVIRPLVLIQFPNGKPETINAVEQELEEMGYTYENGMVAKWMSEDKRQLSDDIISNDGTQAFLLMKQAISTGWDCPRAKILVKLREGMSEQFTIQTIGRIRRMPEAKHYENETLDCCYVYTFDQEYKNGLLQGVERSYETRHLYLKDKCKTFTLVKENRDLDYSGIGAREILERLYNQIKVTYDLTNDCDLNVQKMRNDKNMPLVFGDHIFRKMLRGRFETLSSIEGADTMQTSMKVDTHTHGIQMLHSTNELKTILNLQQYEVRTILERMFLKGVRSEYKLAKLTRPEFYAFVINNEHTLRTICQMVSAEIVDQLQSRLAIDKKKSEFKIPEDDFIKYDVGVKNEVDYLTNAYEKYTSGFATIRVHSLSESMFERYCENVSDSIDWVYKNGDTGQNYLSIVYLTGTGKQRLFYPDYIVKKSDGSIWLIEAKGGESADGESQNIDLSAPNKFDALKNYAGENKVNWGFVRNYNGELFFNNTEWHEEISNENWRPLEEVI